MLSVHTIDHAPEGSRKQLEQVRDKYGMVPNLFGVFAGNPAALEAYIAVGDAFADSGLSAAEQHVVQLAVSTENRCDYCAAAHGTVAKGAGTLDEEARTAIVEGRELEDARLEALRRLALSLVRDRGRPTPEAISEFKAAGYEESDLLAVLVGVAMKTLSNYTNHIAETPVDDAFQAETPPWAKEAADADLARVSA